MTDDLLRTSKHLTIYFLGESQAQCQAHPRRDSTACWDDGWTAATAHPPWTGACHAWCSAAGWRRFSAQAIRRQSLHHPEKHRHWYCSYDGPTAQKAYCWKVPSPDRHQALCAPRCSPLGPLRYFSCYLVTRRYPAACRKVHPLEPAMRCSAGSCFGPEPVSPVGCRKDLPPRRCCCAGSCFVPAPPGLVGCRRDPQLRPPGWCTPSVRRCWICGTRFAPAVPCCHRRSAKRRARRFPAPWLQAMDNRRWGRATRSRASPRSADPRRAWVFASEYLSRRRSPA